MSSRHTSSGETFLIPFGLIFMLAGLGVGIFYFSLLSEWYAARSWVEVPCIIESSTLQDHLEVRPSSHTPVDTLMNEAMAVYRYEFEGKSYQGSTVSLSLGPDNFGDFHERVSDVLREYQNSGKPYRCYVNPDAPEESVIFREARWTVLLFMSVFPLVFPLVGGLTATMGVMSLRKRKQVHFYQSKYPDQPWRWRPGWAEEWMPPNNAGGVWGWVVVLLWMALLWVPMLYALLVDGDVSLSDPVSLVALLPVLPLALVLRGTVKRLLGRAYGQVLLHVEPRPITPGSVMQAYVAIPPRLQLGSHLQMQAEVRCVKQVTTSSGNSTTTSTEIVWSDHVSVPLSEATREITGTRLPLRLEIPAGLPALPADLAEAGWNDRTQHLWELELRAPGLGSVMRYDLPVFQTEAPAPAVSVGGAAPRAATHVLDLDADELTMHLAKHHITAVFDEREFPVSFDLSPKRFAQVRLFLIGFTTIWSVAFLIMLNVDIPFLFPFIWGGSSALLWWVIIKQFERRQLRFNSEGLEIQTSLGPWNSRQTYERRHLVQFLHNINMSSGGTSYYEVRAETTFGKKVTLLDGIPNRLIVENLGPLLERWRKQA